MKRNGKKKDKYIAFRVDEDTYSIVENRAAFAGKDVNVWCRDFFLEMLKGGSPLSINEELMYIEIVTAMDFTLNGFNLIAKQMNIEEKWQKLVGTMQRNRKEMARKYFEGLAKERREEG